MVRTLRLRPEPMTETAFAPFGELWVIRDRPADRRAFTPTGYSHDGRTTVNVIWQPREEPVFNELERHFGVTQGFVQLSGPPAVVCAAPPTATDDPADIPDPESVRAFLIPPGTGYAFRRGTWHSLNRFVLESPGASFLILNSDPNPTQMVDYATGTARIYADLGAGDAPRETPVDAGPPLRFQVDPAALDGA